ncbi:MAG: T9SS type A sorting domain-containing protein [Bacteroidales bacterium]|nr:T9SS type A sorting domain-containing protein [Bacteroidales bacterium]MCF8456449.1 T9SS type A sorting domain-containing protein [Bacteroidales bacterium]
MKTFISTFFALVLSTVLFSQAITTTTLSLDGLSNLSCGVPFYENNVMMTLVQTTPADCVPNMCNFALMTDAIVLAQGRLDVDLTGFLSVQQVQIDVLTTGVPSGTNPFTTWAFLWDGISPTFVSTYYGNGPSPTTIVLNNPGNISLTNLFVSSCAAFIYEIRIIGQLPCTLTGSLSITDASCNSANPGQIQGMGQILTAVTGGTPPYSFLWNTGFTGSFNTMLQGGFYSITVSDSQNCQIVLSGTVNEPPAINVSAVVTDETIFGNCNGAIDISVSGGSPGNPIPYIFSWGSGETTEDLVNLCSGVYTVNVMDSHGCWAMGNTYPVNASYSLAIIPLDNIVGPLMCGSFFIDNGFNVFVGETTPDDACPFECISSVDASSVWLSGSRMTVDLSQIAPGQYISYIEIDVVDYSGIGHTRASIESMFSPISLIDESYNTTMAFETITLHNPGQIALSNLFISGCNTQVHEIRVFTSTSPLPCSFFIQPAITNVSCHGGSNGSIAITQNGTTGPFTFVWENGATTSVISSLTGGNYAVSVTDAFGCTDVSLHSVFEPAALEIQGASITSISFNGVCDGAVDVDVMGGIGPYSFAWDNGMNMKDINGLCLGNYILTVTDLNLCTISGQFPVAEKIENSNGFYIELDGWGVIAKAGGIDNYKEPISSYDINGWYYYPYENWNNIWFDNMPFDSLGYKEVSIEFDLSIGNNGSIDFALNWTSPAWDTLPYFRPPLPNDTLITQNENLYIVRQILLQSDSSQTNQHYTLTYLIPDYCPGWVSVDVRGYNFEITNGIIQHVCMQESQGQLLDLPMGWSIISSYVEPDSALMTQVFADISNHVSIVKNEAGSVYWPVFNVNLIGDWTNGEGYQIKMAVHDSLILQGDDLDPATTPVSMPAGWSLFGYLCQEELPISTMLSSIDSDIIIIKDANGQVYWPAFTVNLIGNLVPGLGYQANMSVANQLYYPCSGAKNEQQTKIPGNSYFGRANKTGSNMTLGIPLWAWDDLPEYGSEVAVFTSSNQLVGSGVFTNHHLAVAIWGNDEYSENKDGLDAGEPFTVQVFDPAIRQVKLLEIESWFDGNDKYATNAISIAEKVSIKAPELKLDLAQNYPNPFSQNTQFTFFLPDAGDVEFEIFNLLGERIDMISPIWYPQGETTISYSNSSLSPGNYFYKLKSQDSSIVKMMTVSE